LTVRVQEYDVTRAALEERIAEELLKKEAHSRGLSVAALLDEALVSRNRPVTPDQTRLVFEGARDRFGGMPEDEALKTIESNLRSQRDEQSRRELVNALRQKYGVQTFLEPPRVNPPAPSKDTPRRGAKDARVVIVAFEDFECQFCARLNPRLTRVVERQPGVELQFRHFPLPFHRDAREAAVAAVCAGKQDRFWEAHDLLFTADGKVGGGTVKRLVGQSGVDLKALEACMNEPSSDARVDEDVNLGRSIGIRNTPTLLINGRFVPGAVPEEVLERFVVEELERASDLQRVTSTASSGGR
jgi:protein-disulfide isomerase